LAIKKEGGGRSCPTRQEESVRKDGKLTQGVVQLPPQREKKTIFLFPFEKKEAETATEKKEEKRPELVLVVGEKRGTEPGREERKRKSHATVIRILPRGKEKPALSCVQKEKKRKRNEKNKTTKR